jgi:hypothetical protein
VAGNTSQTTYGPINIDTTPPQIQLVSPADGNTYTQGQTITAGYSCSDGLSQVATCLGTVVSGTTLNLTTAGTFSFTVTATDQAGNQSMVTHTYTVAPGK